MNKHTKPVIGFVGTHPKGTVSYCDTCDRKNVPMDELKLYMTHYKSCKECRNG